MSVMRSEHQVLLQDLHAMIVESSDHYRDAANFVGQERVVTLFRTIAEERESLATQVAGLIRESGDLPAAPDADRETGKQFFYHLHARFASDQVRDVIRQRVEAEIQLEHWLTGQRETSDSETYRTLLDRLEQQTREARSRLEDMAER